MMSLQQVFTVLLLITSCALSRSDPACLTPTNKNGFCVAIERCRNIYNLLNGGTPTRGHLNYIKKAACTLPNVERSICCQPTEIIPRPIRKFTVGHEPAASTRLNWNLLPTDICGALTIDRSSWAAKTLPFEYPWVVLLRYQTDAGLVDKCGGSLINNRYVLTAAHCIRILDGAKLRKVRLGEHSKNTAVDCIVYTNGEKYCAPEAVDVDIEEMIVHKDFNRPKFRHDIALIRLAEEIEFSESILPTCLPLNESVRQLQLRKYVITGWGAAEKSKTLSQELSQAFVYNLSIPDCEREMKDNYLPATLANAWQLCAKGDNSTNPCIGDSGGPVGYSVANKTAPIFVQFGIIAGGGNFCGQNIELGIYTRVSAYMEWIVANMRP